MATPFEKAKIGKIQPQQILLLILALTIGAIFADAVSRLVFASLGQTPAEPAWNYVLVLYFCLWIAATGIAIHAMFRPPASIATLTQIVSGVVAGALTGFYYGGSLTNNTARWAIVGAIIGGVLATILWWRLPTRVVAVAGAVIGTIAAYGFTFVTWSWAIAFLSTHHYLPGISLNLFSLLYLWATVQNLILVFREIRRSSCFKVNADIG